MITQGNHLRWDQKAMTLDGLWTDGESILVRLYESANHVEYPPNINVYSAYGQVLKGIPNQIKMLNPLLPKDRPRLFVKEMLVTSKYDVYIFRGQIAILEFKNRN